MLLSPAKPGSATAQIDLGRWLDRICPIAFPLIALVLFLLATHHGIGIWPDSARYMNMAHNAWDAPLYPALLQLVAMTGLDIVQGAWLIAIVLAMLNPWLSWHLLRRACGQPAYAAFGTALIVISPQTASLHALAMSEPLFLTMILATLGALMRYLREDDGRWLIIAGLWIGFASLVRFTGPPLGAAIALFLLIDPRHALPRRLANIGRILLPSAAIFLGWALLSEEIMGRSTGRPLELYGNMAGSEWLASFNALTIWILPNGVPFAIRGALFLAVFAASLWLLARQGWQAVKARVDGPGTLDLLAVPLTFFFFAYLLFMVLATSIEANLHLNGRYAYPVYGTSIMAVTIALAWFRDATGPTRLVRHALTALGVAMLLSHGIRTADRTHEAYMDGVGYASRQWVTSPTVAAVGRLPRDAVLYSNGADIIGYLLRRRSLGLPEPFELRTGRDDPAFPYAAQLAAARAALSRGNAYVVFLNGVDWRFYMGSEKELARELDLVRIVKLADGSIYAARTKQVGEVKP
ncbi:glycosyltransferase family 39 protein [Sphingobium sp.]|uniref:glycosyltransferase family 39 protein n=1 Tax=Sphingobium sp. TaxID=1912891 RepID=UPI002B660163|nr:glycosyltransferase family 39 protein [Sphingobium sp.]HUD93447.1 glycosyltransferase family 39 protein [Sphingobium sp.]